MIRSMRALEPVFLKCLAVIWAPDEWLRFWFMGRLKSSVFFPDNSRRPGTLEKSPTEPGKLIFFIQK